MINGEMLKMKKDSNDAAVTFFIVVNDIVFQS